MTIARNQISLNSILIAGLLAMGLLAGSASAQNSVYRWVGEDGGVHYGATPPADVEAELVKSGGPTIGGSTGVSTTTNNTDGPESQAEEAAPEVKLSPEMQARKEATCKQERDRLATLQKPGRIRMKQADGSTKYLSVEEVQAEINLTQEVISDTCN